jgi:CubicO group peptidase (beta-lactamase class C family)
LPENADLIQKCSLFSRLLAAGRVKKKRMKPKIIFTLVACVLLVASAFGQKNNETIKNNKTTKGEIGEKFDTLLRRYTQYGFSGTVLVAQGGKVVLNRGYGMANKELGLSNTPETVFAIGSLTKQFTAAAVLKLEEKGKLKTHDLISKYLGNMPADKTDITIHHLLTHTSGLVSDSANAQFPMDTRNAYVEAVKGMKPRSKPGEKYFYSNVGYNLLAAIVEKVSGLAFEDYLQKNLFKPAGMKNSGFAGKEFWKETVKSVGYEPAAIGSGNVSKAEKPKVSNWSDQGAGGVLTTTGDLYKWHLALKKDKILSAASRKKLYTPFLNDYAYGWEIRKTKQEKPFIQHGGDVPGYQSWYAQFPEDDLLIITLINNRMRWRTLLVNTLQSAAFGLNYEMPPALLPANSLKLENYAGVYRLPSGGTIHSWTSADGFFIGVEGQDAIDLLNRTNEKDAALYRQLNERTKGMIEKFLREDFSPAKEFSGTANPDEQAGAMEKWWKNLVGRHGAVKTFQNLGTLRSRTGHAVSFTRVEYERGTEVLRVLWLSDKITGFGTSVPRPSIAQYMPETQNKFNSFDILTSQLVSVNFGTNPNGAVTHIELGGANEIIKAEKIK